MENNTISFARYAAGEGMVLLKNDNKALPFSPMSTVAIFGSGKINYVKGGSGSADVFSAYSKNIIDGLNEKQSENKIKLYNPLIEAYKKDPNIILTKEIVKQASEICDTALLVISRVSSEGLDREKIAGDFYLSAEETSILNLLQKSTFKSIVVVLNVGSIIDTSWIITYPKVQAILMAWLPGMEGGTAIADILCGDINPSGKLTDTFAASYDDYPSAKTFARDDVNVCYEEDIFVGYRYFETIKTAYNKVVYPFGFGLSYTTFEFSDIEFSVDNINAIVKISVKNIGEYSGKEIVQIYHTSPKGKLDNPAIRLIAYKKTKLLSPGEKQELILNFSLSEMKCFDDTGITGYPYSYVIEQGDYEILVGNSSRSLQRIGTYTVDTLKVFQKLNSCIKSHLEVRLRADGTFEKCNFAKRDNERLENKPLSFESTTKEIQLIDVANGKNSIEQFISQLSDFELIELSQAQPPSFPRGTAGVGNMKKYGIPNPQTADGPAGLRKTVPTTAYPCPTLIGCSWDTELQYEFGKCVAFECLMFGIDILLAPGLNIHRDPLCGRNFEYFSEDPLVSGKTAAAIVKGMQDSGIMATCKHFAANNREFNRMDSSSVISERALREIYLRGFEIVVKEAQPHCIMSSYNLINGVKVSTNKNLLTGVLRDEWGFSGAVMSDWRNTSHLWEEIKAGNNIKMPFGYPDEIELAKQMLQTGKLTRSELESNVKNVLSLVMKTQKFVNQQFDIIHTINDTITKIKAIEITATSYTFTGSETCLDEDGGLNLSCLNKDQRGNNTFLFYNLNILEAGKYIISLRVASPYSEPYFELKLDDQPIGEIHQEQFPFQDDATLWQKWRTTKPITVSLPKGEHMLKVYIITQNEQQKMNLNWLLFEKK